MPKFKKKPVVIEAMQFHATREGGEELKRFIGSAFTGFYYDKDKKTNHE